MADEEKPYRVYRGGRAKGKVPVTRPERAPRGKAAPKDGPERAAGKRRPRLRKRIGLALGLFSLLVLVWLVAGFFAFRSGVADAHHRLPKAVTAGLADQSGLLVSKPTQILLLGTDGDETAARADARRSDSIMIVRTDPGRHRLAYLSIPRDLRVDIPGYGANKINSAFQLGGAALAMKTVKALTGLEIDHVVLVNFADFRQVIDALGGIDIDVQKPILSNRFDCPFATEERCSAWEGWRFPKGNQHLDGRRALIYSRIRENRLDPAESDISRGGRQQDVLEAMTGKLTSVGTFVRLPFVGDDLVKPLTTDLSAGELLQLGWVKFRASASRSLHCRLGGSPSSVGGQSVIIGTEENVSVLSMFTGRSAPQPPLPGSGLYGPGCFVGRGTK